MVSCEFESRSWRGVPDTTLCDNPNIIDYQNRLIFKKGKNCRFDCIVVKDIAYVNDIKLFVSNQKFKKITFIQSIFLKAKTGTWRLFGTSHVVPPYGAPAIHYF